MSSLQHKHTATGKIRRYCQPFKSQYLLYVPLTQLKKNTVQHKVKRLAFQMFLASVHLFTELNNKA
jgi:hypothetical protein